MTGIHVLHGLEETTQSLLLSHVLIHTRGRGSTRPAVLTPASLLLLLSLDAQGQYREHQRPIIPGGEVHVVGPESLRTEGSALLGSDPPGHQARHW